MKSLGALFRNFPNRRRSTTAQKESSHAGESAGELTFVSEPHGITITGYTGSEGVLVIPGEINGQPVTAIGDWAFAWCNTLTQVQLPDTLTTIGEGAFAGCSGLTAIALPAGLTTIRDWGVFMVQPSGASGDSVAGFVYWSGSFRAVRQFAGHRSGRSQYALLQRRWRFVQHGPKRVGSISGGSGRKLLYSDRCASNRRWSLRRLREPC